MNLPNEATTAASLKLMEAVSDQRRARGAGGVMASPAFDVEFAPNGRASRIWMDGHELNAVTDVKIESSVESVTKVTITFLARGGVFLVGYEGRLFNIQSDYQVGEPVDGFDACGCGDQVARGAMYASAHLKGRDRVQMALAASERFSAGVRGPFHIMSLPSGAA